MQQQKTGRFGLVDILLICTAIIWGINVVVVKLALVTLHPLTFNALRFLLATALSWGVLLWRKPQHRVMKKDLFTLIWLGLLGHAVYQVLFIFGINLTSAGNTSLLLATIPIWVALLSAIFTLDEINLYTWVGIGCSFLGIMMVVIGGGKTVGFALHTFRGDAMILAGTLLMAIYTIRSKPLLKHYSPLQLSTYTMTSGAIALGLITLPTFRTTDFGAVDAWGWGGLLFSSLFAIVIGYYIWNTGLSILGPARTAVYQNLAPIVAMITGWVILGERLSLAQFVGASMIIGGLLLARKKSLNRIATSPMGTKPGEEPSIGV